MSKKEAKLKKKLSATYGEMAQLRLEAEQLNSEIARLRQEVDSIAKTEKATTKVVKRPVRKGAKKTAPQKVK